jgi:peptidoglycan hydrolase-like protein with peptidoglycan-binding domain
MCSLRDASMKTLCLFAPFAAVLLAGAAVAQPAAAPASPPPQLSYDQVLAPPAVRSVQDRLRQLGAYSGPVDGVWGDDSQVALQQFQQSHGLQVTGELNQATVALLNLNPIDLLSTGAPPNNVPPPQGRPLSSAEIRNLEARLGALGYYRGPVDGVWGPGMQDALTRFQQASGIAVSGRVNPQTVTAMGLNPNDLSQPAP